MKMHSFVYQDSFTRIFREAFFITPLNANITDFHQQTCTREYYLASKTNEHEWILKTLCRAKASYKGTHSKRFYLCNTLSNLEIGFFLKGFLDSSVGKESVCNPGDPNSIPGLGRSTEEGIGYPLHYSWVSLVAQLVKNLPAMWETWVWTLGSEDPLEKGKATHSSILA